MSARAAALLSPSDVEAARASALRILEGLDRTLLGQQQLTRLRRMVWGSYTRYNRAVTPRDQESRHE